MLTTKERRPSTRTIEGWATSILLEAGAIRECEEHGWMSDRTDPHTRQHAIEIARSDPLPGLSSDAAADESVESLPRSATRVPNAHSID